MIVSLVFVFLSSMVLYKVQNRLPIFKYPNGFIANINPNVQQLWGKIIINESIEEQITSKDNNLPIKLEYNENGEKKFFELFRIYITPEKIIYFFLSDILVIFLSFLITFLFFILYGDIYIFLFFLTSSFALFFNFIYLSSGQLGYLYIFSIYFLSSMSLNMANRMKGKEIQSRWILPQLILSTLLSIIIYQSPDDKILFSEIWELGSNLLLGMALISAGIVLKDLISTKPNSFVLVRRLMLFVSFLFLALLPMTILYNDPLGIFHKSRHLMNVTFLLFIILFVAGSFKQSTIPIQMLFSPAIVSISLISIYTFFYLILSYISIYILKLKILHSNGIFDFLFLLIVAFTLLDLKSKIKNYIDYLALVKNKKISTAMEKIGNLLNSPISMKATIQKMVDISKSLLNVENIFILVPDDQLTLRKYPKNIFINMTSSSPIWRYFSQSKRVTITSHMTYGLGEREFIYNFLNGLGIQMVYPIYDFSTQQIKACILIGEKLNKSNFSISEFRFLKEITRVASLLLDNYLLLAEELEKKRIKKELSTATLVDNALNLSVSLDIKNFHYGSLSIPAFEISGDYMDIIQYDKERVLILLGDVTGHGLGTGYIVSAIKGLVRDVVKKQQSLEALFGFINQFLRERYQGNEFITLLGILYNPYTGELQYLNAGHLPILVLSKKGELKVHGTSQRVLGILETKYNLNIIKTERTDTIILFSDGITETFNQSDVMFGEERFYNILISNAKLSPSEITKIIEPKLAEFRGNRERQDDISLIAFSYKP
jgi:protein phosphatase